AASIAVNTIGNTVDAQVENSDVMLDTGGVTLSAADASHINADSAGAAIALAFSGAYSVALALGAGISANTIHNGVSAAIEDSTVASQDGVSVEATSDATIRAYSFGIAGSVAVGVGIEGDTFAGAGSGSGATISNAITAHISGSTIDAGGAVTVEATDNAAIDTVA